MIVGRAIIPSLLFMKVLQLMLKLSLPIIPICVAGRQGNGMASHFHKYLVWDCVLLEATLPPNIPIFVIGPPPQIKILVTFRHKMIHGGYALMGFPLAWPRKHFLLPVLIFVFCVQLVPQLVYYPSEENFHLWDQSHDSSLGLS